MSDAAEILRRAHRVVLHDWPDTDVPDSLARAGFDVTVFGGPAPDDIFRCEVVGSEVISRKVGVPPDEADVVFVYRPLEELPHILDEAKQIGATVIWRQSGCNEAGEQDQRGHARADDSDQWRSMVEEAGLQYIEDAYIGDVARQVAGQW